MARWLVRGCTKKLSQVAFQGARFRTSRNESVSVMSWKRLLVSIPLGLLIIVADGVSLMLVNRLYRPGHPPAWVTHAFYLFDAWPLFITQHIFPNEAHGPTFLAVAAAALIDLIIFAAIIYALLSWRARRKARG